MNSSLTGDCQSVIFFFVTNTPKKMSKWEIFSLHILKCFCHVLFLSGNFHYEIKTFWMTKNKIKWTEVSIGLSICPSKFIDKECYFLLLSYEKSIRIEPTTYPGVKFQLDINYTTKSWVMCPKTKNKKNLVRFFFISMSLDEIKLSMS